MFDERLTHATFTLPKPEVHAQHPFRNRDNHAKLKNYLTARLEHDKPNRDSRIDRYAQIDRDVAAWIRMSDEDRKRRDKHARDGTPQATQMNLPLSWVHLDDMMTYYAQTFAPNRGMFYHTGKPEDTKDASQLVAIMNSHAVYGGYYRELLRAIFAVLKYNIGGLSTLWATEYGPTLGTGPGGELAIDMKPIFRGNKIHAFDMYNLYWDPSVDPSRLHKEGEWFAEAKMRSHYWLKNKCLEGVYFNAQEILDDELTTGTLSAKYYTDPPVYSKIQSDESSGGGQSWYSILAGDNGMMLNGAFELVEIYIKINPNDFGLIPGNALAKAARNRYETWKFTILNDTQIIEAQFMNNIHGHLPAYFGVAHDDIMGQAAKGPAEILNPLQEFSSFLMNTHVQANRKNLYGTTYYDPSCVDMDKIPQGEVAARVPLKPQGWGKDIRTMIQRDDHLLDTKQTLQDLEGMMGIINQFFPTQSLPSQIASIDRAVDSQVAAVQQGANRRQHKGARLMDDTMMRPLRFSLYYNIVQYMQDGEEIVDYFRSTTDTVDLSKLRNTNLATVIGQGLKAIDRQAAASLMQQIVFALIQAPQTAQGVDLLGMIDYWTSMMDIDTSVKEFAVPVQQPGAIDPATGQPIPAGGGAPIVPATNPQNVTAPIYG